MTLPSQALAEYYVPPGNSAANQYTESLPGAGGESGGKHKQATPGQTLGAKNAKRLEKHGAAGKATAEVAAETAPSQIVPASPAPASSGGTPETAGREPRGDARAGGTSSSRPSTASSGNGAGRKTAPPQPAGSAAVGQVVGQATGTGNGSFGLWLPLALALTLIGSIAYRVRMRHAQPGRHV